MGIIDRPVYTCTSIGVCKHACINSALPACNIGANEDSIASTERTLMKENNSQIHQPYFVSRHMINSRVLHRRYRICTCGTCAMYVLVTSAVGLIHVLQIYFYIYFYLFTSTYGMYIRW